MFEERKAFAIRLPFFPNNESFTKTFISKLIYSTSENRKFNVVLSTKKSQSMFPLKDKVDHYVIFGEIVLVTNIVFER